MRPRRGLFAIIALGVSVSLLGLGFGAWKAWGQRPFDSAEWKAAAPPPNHCAVEGDPRHRMVGDLLENYLEAGMQMQQVSRLLGPPDYATRVGRTAHWRWPTALGFTRCFYLYVSFVSGRLTKAREYE